MHSSEPPMDDVLTGAIPFVLYTPFTWKLIDCKRTHFLFQVGEFLNPHLEECFQFTCKVKSLKNLKKCFFPSILLVALSVLTTILTQGITPCQQMSNIFISSGLLFVSALFPMLVTVPFIQNYLLNCGKLARHPAEYMNYMDRMVSCDYRRYNLFVTVVERISLCLTIVGSILYALSDEETTIWFGQVAPYKTSKQAVQLTALLASHFSFVNSTLLNRFSIILQLSHMIAIEILSLSDSWGPTTFCYVCFGFILLLANRRTEIKHRAVFHLAVQTREKTRLLQSQTRDIDTLRRSQLNFFLKMIHELKTPLNGQLNSLFLLREVLKQPKVRQGLKGSVRKLVNTYSDTAEACARFVELLVGNLSDITMTAESAIDYQQNSKALGLLNNQGYKTGENMFSAYHTGVSSNTIWLRESDTTKGFNTHHFEEDIKENGLKNQAERRSQKMEINSHISPTKHERKKSNFQQQTSLIYCSNPACSFHRSMTQSQLLLVSRESPNLNLNQPNIKDLGISNVPVDGEDKGFDIVQHPTLSQSHPPPLTIESDDLSISSSAFLRQTITENSVGSAMHQQPSLKKEVIDVCNDNKIEILKGSSICECGFVQYIIEEKKRSKLHETSVPFTYHEDEVYGDNQNISIEDLVERGISQKNDRVENQFSPEKKSKVTDDFSLHEETASKRNLRKTPQQSPPHTPPHPSKIALRWKLNPYLYDGASLKLPSGLTYIEMKVPRGGATLFQMFSEAEMSGRHFTSDLILDHMPNLTGSKNSDIISQNHLHPVFVSTNRSMGVNLDASLHHDINKLGSKSSLSLNNAYSGVRNTTQKTSVLNINDVHGDNEINSNLNFHSSPNILRDGRISNPNSSQVIFESENDSKNKLPPEYELHVDLDSNCDSFTAAGLSNPHFNNHLPPNVSSNSVHYNPSSHTQSLIPQNAFTTFHHLNHKASYLPRIPLSDSEPNYNYLHSHAIKLAQLTDVKKRDTSARRQLKRLDDLKESYLIHWLKLDQSDSKKSKTKRNKSENFNHPTKHVKNRKLATPTSQQQQQQQQQPSIFQRLSFTGPSPHLGISNNKSNESRAIQEGKLHSSNLPPLPDHAQSNGSLSIKMPLPPLPPLSSLNLSSYQLNNNNNNNMNNSGYSVQSKSLGASPIPNNNNIIPLAGVLPIQSPFSDPNLSLLINLPSNINQIPLDDSNVSNVPGNNNITSESIHSDPGANWDEYHHCQKSENHHQVINKNYNKSKSKLGFLSSLYSTITNFVFCSRRKSSKKNQIMWCYVIPNNSDILKYHEEKSTQRCLKRKFSKPKDSGFIQSKRLKNYLCTAIKEPGLCGSANNRSLKSFILEEFVHQILSFEHPEDYFGSSRQHNNTMHSFKNNSYSNHNNQHHSTSSCSSMDVFRALPDPPDICELSIFDVAKHMGLSMNLQLWISCCIYDLRKKFSYLFYRLVALFAFNRRCKRRSQPADIILEEKNNHNEISSTKSWFRFMVNKDKQEKVRNAQKLHDVLFKNNNYDDSSNDDLPKLINFDQKMKVNSTKPIHGSDIENYLSTDSNNSSCKMSDGKIHRRQTRKSKDNLNSKNLNAGDQAEASSSPSDSDDNVSFSKFAPEFTRSFVSKSDKYAASKQEFSTLFHPDGGSLSPGASKVGCAGFFSLSDLLLTYYQSLLGNLPSIYVSGGKISISLNGMSSGRVLPGGNRLVATAAAASSSISISPSMPVRSNSKQPSYNNNTNGVDEASSIPVLPTAPPAIVNEKNSSLNPLISQQQQSLLQKQQAFGSRRVNTLTNLLLKYEHSQQSAKAKRTIYNLSASYVPQNYFHAQQNSSLNFNSPFGVSGNASEHSEVSTSEFMSPQNNVTKQQHVKMKIDSASSPLTTKESIVSKQRKIPNFGLISNSSNSKSAHKQLFSLSPNFSASINRHQNQFDTVSSMSSLSSVCLSEDSSSFDFSSDKYFSSSSSSSYQAVVNASALAHPTSPSAQLMVQHYKSDNRPTSNSKSKSLDPVVNNSMNTKKPSNVSKKQHLMAKSNNNNTDRSHQKSAEKNLHRVFSENPISPKFEDAIRAVKDFKRSHSTKIKIHKVDEKIVARLIHKHQIELVNASRIATNAVLYHMQGGAPSHILNGSLKYSMGGGDGISTPDSRCSHPPHPMASSSQNTTYAPHNFTAVASKLFHPGTMHAVESYPQKIHYISPQMFSDMMFYLRSPSLYTTILKFLTGFIKNMFACIFCVQKPFISARDLLKKSAISNSSRMAVMASKHGRKISSSNKQGSRLSSGLELIRGSIPFIGPRFPLNTDNYALEVAASAITNSTPKIHGMELTYDAGCILDGFRRTCAMNEPSIRVKGLKLKVCISMTDSIRSTTLIPSHLHPEFTPLTAPQTIYNHTTVFSHDFANQHGATSHSSDQNIAEGIKHQNYDSTLNHLHSIPLNSNNGVNTTSRSLKLPLEVPPHFITWFDQTRFTQAINNLLSNAVKYTEQGEIEISLHFEPWSWSAPTLVRPLTAVDTIAVGAPGEFPPFHALSLPETYPSKTLTAKHPLWRKNTTQHFGNALPLLNSHRVNNNNFKQQEGVLKIEKDANSNSNNANQNNNEFTKLHQQTSINSADKHNPSLNNNSQVNAGTPGGTNYSNTNMSNHFLPRSSSFHPASTFAAVGGRTIESPSLGMSTTFSPHENNNLNATNDQLKLNGGGRNVNTLCSPCSEGCDECTPPFELWFGRITIKDSGRGIHQDDIKNIFKDFHQVFATDAHVGTGLGLSIVANTVMRVRGGISLASEGIPGRGSVVEIWFPIWRLYDGTQHTQYMTQSLMCLPDMNLSIHFVRNFIFPSEGQIYEGILHNLPKNSLFPSSLTAPPFFEDYLPPKNTAAINNENDAYSDINININTTETNLHTVAEGMTTISRANFLLKLLEIDEYHGAVIHEVLTKLDGPPFSEETLRNIIFCRKREIRRVCQNFINAHQRHMQQDSVLNNTHTAAENSHILGANLEFEGEPYDKKNEFNQLDLKDICCTVNAPPSTDLDAFYRHKKTTHAQPHKGRQHLLDFSNSAPYAAADDSTTGQMGCGDRNSNDSEFIPQYPQEGYNSRNTGSSSFNHTINQLNMTSHSSRPVQLQNYQQQQQQQFENSSFKSHSNLTPDGMKKNILTVNHANELPKLNSYKDVNQQQIMIGEYNSSLPGVLIGSQLNTQTATEANLTDQTSSGFNFLDSFFGKSIFPLFQRKEESLEGRHSSAEKPNDSVNATSSQAKTSINHMNVSVSSPSLNPRKDLMLLNNTINLSKNSVGSYLDAINLRTRLRSTGMDSNTNVPNADSKAANALSTAGSNNHSALGSVLKPSYFDFNSSAGASPLLTLPNVYKDDQISYGNTTRTFRVHERLLPSDLNRQESSYFESNALHDDTHLEDAVAGEQMDDEDLHDDESVVDYFVNNQGVIRGTSTTVATTTHPDGSTAWNRHYRSRQQDSMGIDGDALLRENSGFAEQCLLRDNSAYIASPPVNIRHAITDNNNVHTAPMNNSNFNANNNDPATFTHTFSNSFRTNMNPSAPIAQFNNNNMNNNNISFVSPKHPPLLSPVKHSSAVSFQSNITSLELLIVDDDPLNHLVVNGLLKVREGICGCSVRSVASGSAAASALESAELRMTAEVLQERACIAQIVAAAIDNVNPSIMLAAVSSISANSGAISSFNSSNYGNQNSNGLNMNNASIRAYVGALKNSFDLTWNTWVENGKMTAAKSLLVITDLNMKDGDGPFVGKVVRSLKKRLANALGSSSSNSRSISRLQQPKNSFDSIAVNTLHSTFDNNFSNNMLTNNNNSNNNNSSHGTVPVQQRTVDDFFASPRAVFTDHDSALNHAGGSNSNDKNRNLSSMKSSISSPSSVTLEGAPRVLCILSSAQPEALMSRLIPNDCMALFDGYLEKPVQVDILFDYVLRVAGYKNTRLLKLYAAAWQMTVSSALSRLNSQQNNKANHKTSNSNPSGMKVDEHDGRPLTNWLTTKTSSSAQQNQNGSPMNASSGASFSVGGTPLQDKKITGSPNVRTNDSKNLSNRARNVTNTRKALQNLELSNDT